MSSVLTARYLHGRSQSVVTRAEMRGRKLLKDEALLHPTSGNFEIALDKSGKPSVNRNLVESLNNRTYTVNGTKTNQLHQSSTQVRLSLLVNRIF